MKNIMMCVTAATLLGACTTPPPAFAPAAQSTPAASTKPTSAATAPVAALAPYKDPSNILYTQRSVYFDFDRYTIKPAYETVLDAHGKFLSMTPTVKVRIEGYSDERGGSEYNLALGQKRAEAVKKFLMFQGVKEAQLEAVSFGKEKPKST